MTDKPKGFHSIDKNKQRGVLHKIKKRKSIGSTPKKRLKLQLESLSKEKEISDQQIMSLAAQNTALKSRLKR